MPSLSSSFLSKLERSGLLDLVARSMRVRDTQFLKKSSGVKASRVGATRGREA